MLSRRRPNPGLGLLLDLLTAAGLSVIAVVLYLVDGPQRFEQNQVSLLGALGLYFLGGAIGGPIFGFLLPLTVRRSGAVLAASSPLYRSVRMIC